MAMAASAGLNLGRVFKLTGRQLIALYLCHAARSGKLSDALLPGDCSVAAGVDVFSASPNALPFQPSHRGQCGEVWGYFAAAQVAESIQPAPRGCWVRHGKEKPYVFKGETVGYRSRFAFHVTRVEGDGNVLWAPTRWMMKEYRLEKDAAIFRTKKLECPEANLDIVIRKVFTKPVAVPVLPPNRPGKALHVPPVKASVVAVRKDSTKTKTKTKTKAKKVVPPPLPPYARSEGGVALQQGGSSLPPRSARPPRPPKVVGKPVAPPPPAQVIPKPLALPAPPKVIATPVVPAPPRQVIAMPVAPPPTPWVIAKPMAPPPTPKGIANPVFPAPPRQVIATPVAPLQLPARSSQDEATSSRSQPDNPNANMELVVRTVPAKPLILPPPPAQFLGHYIIANYLFPKAIHGQFFRVATPGFVAEGVDVFAVSPDALHFPPGHRKQNGEVWGYFFAPKPISSSMRLAPGGRWMKYGSEKGYLVPGSGQVVACHRRFAYHAARVDGDGKVAWEQTRWLMKEYRLNKALPAARKVKTGPSANMDLVVLKVFTKPVVAPPPPQPPARSGDAVNEGAECSRPVVPRPLPPPEPPACTFD